MKKFFTIVLLCGALYAAKPKKPPDPVIGKLFVQNEQGKWVRFTSEPNDILFLHCADGRGKFRPCIIGKVEFSPGSEDKPSEFGNLGKLYLQPKPKLSTAP